MTLFTVDTINGVNEDYLEQLQEDVTAFNGGKAISWYKHSLYACFMKLDIQEVKSNGRA